MSTSTVVAQWWIHEGTMANIRGIRRHIVPLLCLAVIVAGNGAHKFSPPSPCSAESSACQADSATAKVLETIGKWKRGIHRNERPFVTLTFAQSLDGKIALYTGDSKNQTSSNFPISGPESLVMTHGLRSIHDAILVGGRTLSTDNPRLSNRLWKPSQHQPRPVVLDTHLSHVRRVKTIRAKNLIICCSHEAAAAYRQGDCGISTSFDLLPCPLVDGRLDLSYILSELRKEYAIESLMVEGGSQVLSMFMERELVDCLCVTIAPKLFGGNGLSAYSCSWFAGNPLQPMHVGLDETHFFPLVGDCVLLGRWRPVSVRSASAPA
jgi:riboflavin-specific deaminase-like protein